MTLVLVSLAVWVFLPVPVGLAVLAYRALVASRATPSQTHSRVPGGDAWELDKGRGTLRLVVSKPAPPHAGRQTWLL